MSSQLNEQTTLSGNSGNHNALTHGGTSQKLILATENRADFKALLAGLQAEYGPETQQHHLFIEQLALGHWFLLRRQRAYTAIEASVYESVDHDPELLREDHFRRLALTERYKVAAERALKRAFGNAESIRKERKNEHCYRERHARWQAEQQLREQRLEVQKEKNKAAETRTRKRAERQVAKNPPPRPALQWPERAYRGPAAEEIRTQTFAGTDAIRNTTK